MGLMSAATVTEAIGCAPTACHPSVAFEPSPVPTLVCHPSGTLDACWVVTAEVPLLPIIEVHAAPLGSLASSKSTQA